MSPGTTDPPRPAVPPEHSIRQARLRRSDAVLALGLTVLAVGAGAFFLVRGRAPRPSGPPAAPAFEVAYADVPLSVYRTLLHPQPGADPPIPGALAYRVLENEVAGRIASDSAYLRPVLPPMPAVEGGPGFAAEIAAGRLRFESTGVVMLIVRQVGRGDADSVALDLYRITVPNAFPVADPTDIEAFAPRRPGEQGLWEGKDEGVRRDSLRVALGRMSTGDAVVVPLYSILEFRSPEDGTEWGFVKDLAFVPANLHHRSAERSETIRIRRVLAEPILIGAGS